MSFAEAFKGAKAELAAIRSPVRRAITALRISRILLGEAAGLLSMVPYGYRALRLHQSLPSMSDMKPGPNAKVTICRDVTYASRPRSVLDIYVPPAPAYGKQRPVALFCHGGVWAAGEKWQYAPLATSLAQAGVMVVVMHYTLYPNALVPQLAAEVSEALSWTLDHIADLGGDASQVSLIGHSAGAQLCAMALLHRAMAAHRQLGEAGPQQQADWDPRMPARAILICGVYDIAKHYEYEQSRGVHGISTMERAVGGVEGFAACSPAVVLADALARHAGHVGAEAGVGTGRYDTNSSSRFQLAGEAIASRIGFDRLEGRPAYSHIHAPSLQESARFDRAAAAHLPPTFLMSSCTDIVVPWYESAEMYWLLHDCGVPAKHLVYNRVGHAEFVINWQEQHFQPERLMREYPELPQEVPAYNADLLKLVLGTADAPRNGNGVVDTAQERQRAAMAAH